MQTTEMIDQFSYKQLNASSDSFKNSNRIEGFNHFNLIYPTYQRKVYEQIWIDRGKPKGNAEYGKQTFHDADGQYSTMQEKAAAVDHYLESIDDKERLIQEDRYAKMIQGSNSSDYEWSHVNGKWECHPKGRPPLIKTDKVWCPITKDECLQVVGALGAVGAIAAGAYAAYQIFKAIRPLA